MGGLMPVISSMMANQPAVEAKGSAMDKIYHVLFPI
jgi:hypothetical protein